MTTQQLLEKANAAKRSVAFASGEDKNRLLRSMADRLRAEQAEILRANEQDLEAARGRIGEVMLDRLRLTEETLRELHEKYGLTIADDHD